MFLRIPVYIFITFSNFTDIGVGDGVGSVLFAQIVRTSSVEERTSVLSMAMAARQIGLVVGR